MEARKPQSPPGYIHLRPLFSDWDSLDRYPQWMVLIWANLMALLPLSGGLLLLWLPYQLSLCARQPNPSRHAIIGCNITPLRLCVKVFQ